MPSLSSVSRQLVPTMASEAAAVPSEAAVVPSEAAAVSSEAAELSSDVHIFYLGREGEREH